MGSIIFWRESALAPFSTWQAEAALLWEGYLAETASSKNCDKKPTPHCFRHTFVVNRINMWIERGMDLDVMLPYLSKYLGHTDPQETFYYYHIVSDAFRILKRKDKTSSGILPEVRRR